MGEAGVHQAVQAVDVEHRDRHERHVVGAEVVDGCRLRQVGDQVAMGQHHALGQTRGSRRVRQRGRAVGEVEPLLVERLAEQLLERRVTDDGHGPAAGSRSRGSCRQRADDQEVGTGVVELVGDLVGAVGRVDRGDRRPGEGDRVEHDREVRAVAGDQRHRAAGRDAPSVEAAGEASHVIEHGAAGPHRAVDAVDDGDPFGVIRGGAERVVGDRRVGDVDVGQPAPHDPCCRRRCGAHGAATGSRRAGTVLCHGVPAKRSRWNEPVRVFGATPSGTRSPSTRRSVPVPLGRAR